MAFECIPKLSKQYQEGVIGANDGCPRMCKKKFKDNGMTGFPLEEVNQALGTTKVKNVYECVYVFLCMNVLTSVFLFFAGHN